MNKLVIKNRYGFDIELTSNNPKKAHAVVIVSHGASEHIGRYTRLFEYLEQHDVKVIGYDHLSHGKRQLENANCVFFGDCDGHQNLVDDLEDVALFAYQNNPSLPIIILAHSMGSLIARSLSIKTKFNFDGIILCGSLHPKKEITMAGLQLAKFMTRLNKNGTSKILNRVAFGNLKGKLSFNKENIDEYVKDEKCGQPFSNQAIVDLMKLVNQVADEKNVVKMLKTKYFIIAGKEDPLSNNTKQLITFMNEMDIAYLDYDYKFYPNMRHEILNEKFNEGVYADILKFCLSLNK